MESNPFRMHQDVFSSVILTDQAKDKTAACYGFISGQINGMPDPAFFSIGMYWCRIRHSKYGKKVKKINARSVLPDDTGKTDPAFQASFTLALSGSGVYSTCRNYTPDPEKRKCTESI